jgi:hypothetical protein
MCSVSKTALVKSGSADGMLLFLCAVVQERECEVRG